MSNYAVVLFLFTSFNRGVSANTVTACWKNDRGSVSVRIRDFCLRQHCVHTGSGAILASHLVNARR